MDTVRSSLAKYMTSLGTAGMIWSRILTNLVGVFRALCQPRDICLFLEVEIQLSASRRVIGSEDLTI